MAAVVIVCVGCVWIHYARRNIFLPAPAIVPMGRIALVVAPSSGGDGSATTTLERAFHVAEVLGFRAVHYRGDDVWRAIAGDELAGDGDWTLVLDARARLHPDAVHPRRLLALAMQRERTVGLIHLGLRAATCAVWPWPWNAIARGCTSSSSTSVRGGDSDSFLITRRQARTMSERRGGAVALPAATTFVGSFMAPHLRGDGDQRGLLITHPRTIAPTHTATLLPPCFGTVLNSRLGNLMFEYASLVGICVRRGLDPATCASLSGNVLNVDRVDLPISELVNTFALPTPFCAVAHDGPRYQEHADKPHAIEFDIAAFHQPIGTVFTGYMQSFKYFSPHADSHVRRAFRFPAAPRAAAEAFLAAVRRDAAAAAATGGATQGTRRAGTSSVRVVCVSVRRGDKVRWQTAGYNQWALSDAYYAHAIDHVLRADAAAAAAASPVALVFFTGGGFSRVQQREDRQWVRDRLAARYERARTARPFPVRTYVEPASMDHVASMACMARCDALVVSASSFSWWAGFLSDNRTIRVIVAPRDIHDASFGFRPQDYYPAHWTLLAEGRNASDARVT